MISLTFTTWEPLLSFKIIFCMKKIFFHFLPAATIDLALIYKSCARTYGSFALPFGWPGAGSAPDDTRDLCVIPNAVRELHVCWPWNEASAALSPASVLLRCNF